MAFLDSIGEAFGSGILGKNYDPESTILGMNPAQLAIAGGQLGSAIAGPDSIGGRIGGIGSELGRSRVAADSAKEQRAFFAKLLSSALTGPGELGATSMKRGKDGKYTVDFDVPGTEDALEKIAGVETPTLPAPTTTGTTTTPSPSITPSTDPTEPPRTGNVPGIGGDFSNF